MMTQNLFIIFFCLASNKKRLAVMMCARGKGRERWKDRWKGLERWKKRKKENGRDGVKEGEMKSSKERKSER